MAITRYQNRRGTASEWTAANPVLLDGEIGFERDTRKFKLGDGVTAWNALAYANSGASGAFTVKGPFVLAHDTPGIDSAQGVALWTPAVGDIAAGFDVRIVTPFQAGNFLDIGSYTGLSEDLDTFQIGPGVDGTDYSQVGARWKTFLTTAEVRAKIEVPASAGSLILRAYVIPAP